MIRPFVLPMVAFAMIPAIACADLLGELSTADQAKLRSGAQVTVTEALDGYPWPRVRVYEKCAGTPREVMAVFCDYNRARNYIPNCLKSEISRKVDAATFEVDYVIDVPILADEAYTVRNTLTPLAGEALQVQWRVLKATSIAESAGDLVVEPFEGGSILRYTNLVKPSSRAAVLLRGMALSQMKETVKALVDQVEKCAKSADGMKAPLERLDAAVAGAKK